MIRAPLLCLVLAGAALSTPVRAGEPGTFLLPDNDGYGIGDCLAAGPRSACGRIVADAWCESKGFAKAKTFGREDMSDVTGSVPSEAARTTPASIARAPGLVAITCEK
jgi:hypothetical protein